MAALLGGEGEYRGELSWKGGGLYYEVSPSQSGTTIVHSISDVGAPVYRVIPCPDGAHPPSADSNVVTDCSLRLETEVELSLETEDGSLSESWRGTLSASGLERWQLHAASAELSGAFQVTAGPSGSLTYNCFAERNGEVVSGSFGGMTETSRMPQTGSGTGFNAGEWTSRPLSAGR
jgi:hypothetical protein